MRGCSRLEIRRWTAGYVKLILPPRQSRGSPADARRRRALALRTRRGCDAAAHRNDRYARPATDCPVLGRAAAGDHDLRQGPHLIATPRRPNGKLADCPCDRPQRPGTIGSRALGCQVTNRAPADERINHRRRGRNWLGSGAFDHDSDRMRPSRRSDAEIPRIAPAVTVGEVRGDNC